MIDLNAIEKGELYRDLKESIIIFICKFDPFGFGLCRYTFENVCIEDKDIHLKDGTSKIFFNTKSYANENNKSIQSFLEYVERNTLNSNDFVKKIDRKVKNIKENRKWRAEYMKQLMKEREIAKDSFEKGRLEGAKEGELIGEARGRIEGIREGDIRGIKKINKHL